MSNYLQFTQGNVMKKSCCICFNGRDTRCIIPWHAVTSFQPIMSGSLAKPWLPFQVQNGIPSNCVCEQWKWNIWNNSCLILLRRECLQCKHMNIVIYTKIQNKWWWHSDSSTSQIMMDSIWGLFAVCQCGFNISMWDRIYDWSHVLNSVFSTKRNFFICKILISLSNSSVYIFWLLQQGW